MKKILLLSAMILFAMGCQKENAFQEAEKALKEDWGRGPAGVTVPATTWFTTVPDYTLEVIVCSPVEIGIGVLEGGFMKGHQTHGGRLQTMKSPWQINSCEIHMEEGYMTGYIAGKITVSSGDYYHYTGVINTSIMDGSVWGTISVDGGTGRYKNAKGEFELNGYYDFEANEASFQGEGYFTFYK